MECHVIFVFLLVLSDHGLGQYTCSYRHDGRSTPCDCNPECFDLSDETQCADNTSIHDVLYPQYWTMGLTKVASISTETRFFPPPPLPPFRLCPEITSTDPTIQTTVSPISSTLNTPNITHASTRHHSYQTASTISTATATATTTTAATTAAATTAPATATSTLVPPPPPTTQRTVTVPDRRLTTAATPTTDWMTQKPTLSPWLCGVFLREYYTRCRIVYTEFCRYLTKALRQCARETMLTTTTTTTTTTRPPPIFLPTTLFPFYSFDYYYNFNYMLG